MTNTAKKDRRTAEHSSMSASRRRLRAQLAANTRWANDPDRAAGTQAARDTFMARFEAQVDPDGSLPAPERARRAEAARRAHFQRMAFARHAAS